MNTKIDSTSKYETHNDLEVQNGLPDYNDSMQDITRLYYYKWDKNPEGYSHDRVRELKNIIL